jgi:hypothetical protein
VPRSAGGGAIKRRNPSVIKPVRAEKNAEGGDMNEEPTESDRAEFDRLERAMTEATYASIGKAISLWSNTEGALVSIHCGVGFVGEGSRRSSHSALRALGFGRLTPFTPISMLRLLFGNGLP